MTVASLLFRAVRFPFRKMKVIFQKNHLSFAGDFFSWHEANRLCSGYHKHNILEKVRDALLKVKAGEAAYERDSVTFEKIQYSWPTLAGILWAAACTSNRGLNVLDFGGSLGTTYFQNRKFLTRINLAAWNIVEQPEFVKIGKESFQTNKLRFYDSLDECLNHNKIDLLLLSSVLQFVEDPYGLLERLFGYKIPWIIIDLTGFTYNDRDRITIETVDPLIYQASYPSWFFGLTRFLLFFDKHYELIESFEAFTGQVIHIDGKAAAGYKGFIFRIKDC